MMVVGRVLRPCRSPFSCGDSSMERIRERKVFERGVPGGGGQGLLGFDPELQPGLEPERERVRDHPFPPPVSLAESRRWNPVRWQGLLPEDLAEEGEGSRGPGWGSNQGWNPRLNPHRGLGRVYG